MLTIAEKLGIAADSFVLTATPQNGKASGIKLLEDKISALFMTGGISKDDVFISNDRQKNALIKAQNMIKGMISGIEAGVPADLLYVDLEDIISALGEITGVTVQDEIIDRVFERFCVGK